MNDREFRNAMGKFATGITVITTEVEGEAHGMTANAFMSVSLSPRLIVISIGEKAKILEKINQSNKFAVNILAEEQQDMSMYFSGQKGEAQTVEFTWKHGLPLLENTLGNVICDVHSKYVVGDHTLFIGEVIDFAVNEGEPLTYYGGQYRTLTTQS